MKSRTLLAAVSDNNLEEVRQMLDAHLNVSPQSPWHIDNKGSPAFRTPLGLACLLGHEDIARLLLARGASLNIESTIGLPLCEALSNGHVNIAKLLIEKGALSFLEDKPAMISVMLYAAVIAGDIGIIQQILAVRGSHLGVLYACQESVENVRFIAERIGDETISQRVKSYIEEVTSNIVCENDFEAEREALGVMTTSKASPRAPFRITAALVARLFGREEMLTLLVKHQRHTVLTQLANRNHHADDDMVEAALAMMNDDFDLLQAVYQRGKLQLNLQSRNQTDACLQEVAYIPAMYGRMQMLRWLHAKGVNLIEVPEYLKSPFKEAVKQGEADAVDFLIAIGANFTRSVIWEANSHDGRVKSLTPLEVADEMRHVGVMKVLLAHNVNYSKVSSKALTKRFMPTTNIFSLVSDASNAIEINEMYSRETVLENATVNNIIEIINDRRGCQIYTAHDLIAFRVRFGNTASIALRNYVGLTDKVEDVGEKELTEFIISKSTGLAFLYICRNNPGAWRNSLKRLTMMELMLTRSAPHLYTGEILPLSIVLQLVEEDEKLFTNLQALSFKLSDRKNCLTMSIQDLFKLNEADYKKIVAVLLEAKFQHEKWVADKVQILNLFPRGLLAEIKASQTQNKLTLEMSLRCAAIARPVLLALGLDNPVGGRQVIVLQSEREPLAGEGFHQLLQARENTLTRFVSMARQLERKCKVVYGQSDITITFRHPQNAADFNQALPDGMSYETIFAYDNDALAAIQATLPAGEEVVVEKIIDINAEVHKFSRACDALSTQFGVDIWCLANEEVVSKPLLARYAAVLRSLNFAGMTFEAGDKVVARLPINQVIALKRDELDSINLQIIEAKRKIELLDTMVLKTWKTDKKRFQAEGLVFVLKNTEYKNYFNECCPGLVKLLDAEQQEYGISYQAILGLDVKVIEEANAKLCKLLLPPQEKHQTKASSAVKSVAVVAVPVVHSAAVSAKKPKAHHSSGNNKKATNHNKRGAAVKAAATVLAPKTEKPAYVKRTGITPQKINPRDLSGLPARAPYVHVAASGSAIDFSKPSSAPCRFFKPEKLNLVTEISISFGRLIECQQLIKARTGQHGRTNKILLNCQTVITDMEVCLLDLDALWQNVHLDPPAIEALGPTIIEFLNINREWVKSCEENMMKVMDKLEMICVHADEGAGVWNTRLSESLQAAKDSPLPDSPRM